MDHLPLRDASVDLVVAHGIWNLARSTAEFRRAIAEAARVARPGAGLFVFTFSRATLAPGDQPVPGEPFVFTQFAGEPQCFLTETELVDELRRAGFEKDPPGPLTEYNRPVARPHAHARRPRHLRRDLPRRPAVVNDESALSIESSEKPLACEGGMP